MIMITRMTSAQVNCGEGYEFEGIFAAVVGGVSMAGGEGSVLGAVVGALIVAVLRNGLNLNGINSFWQWTTRQLPINLNAKRFPFSLELPVVKPTGSWQTHVDAAMIL